MTILTRTARGALAVTALAGLAVLAACEHGDPVSEGGGPLGRATLISSTPSAATLPRGTATSYTRFGGFSTALDDAFGRRSSNATQARRTQAFISFTGCCSIFEWYQSGGRNASPELLDPRLPAIQSTTAVIDDPEGGYLDLYTPDPAFGYPGADFWELYTPGFSGLEPGTQYQVAFVHYRLEVRGELDHVERMLTGTVTEPDSLVKVSGTAAEINTDWGDAAPEGCAPYPGPTANPFVIATQDADDDGFVAFDKCWQSTNGIWGLDNFDQQARSMIGRNDNVAYDLPNYNYIEVWEGTYGAGPGPVFRMQIAQDLDLNGKPIANAYAPFPTPASPLVVEGAAPLVATGSEPIPDLQPTFPLGEDVLATLTGAIGVPDSVSITLNSLARLEQGAYKVWYLNPTTGAAKPAVGTYTRTLSGVVQDDAAAGVSTFAGGPGTITFTSRPYLEDAGAYTDSLRIVVVTKEADAAAAAPSGSQPLWQSIFKLPPAVAGGNLLFGDFNSGTGPFRFVPQGTLSGAILGDTVPVFVTESVDGQQVQVRQLEFRGSVIEVTMTGLTRPPEGYRYQAYLFTAASAEPAVDSALVSMGGLKDRSGASLDDADTAAPGANVSATRIEFGQVRYDVATEGPADDTICQYDRLRVYLEPKGMSTAEHPPTRIFDLALPGRIATAARCQ